MVGMFTEFRRYGIPQVIFNSVHSAKTCGMARKAAELAEFCIAELVFYLYGIPYRGLGQISAKFRHNKSIPQIVRIPRNNSRIKTELAEILRDLPFN